jgi:putative FmdB family regulatory protein
MPLYEYKCKSCNEVFEVIQRFSDEPLKTHDRCGGQVERLLSAPAFQFKGSGWYITDYARSGRSNGSNKKPEQDTAKPETKSDKAESKPASDTSPKK